MSAKEIKIIPFRAGYSNVVLLLNGGRSVLIDTGVKRQLEQLKLFFSRHGLQPTDIQLIVLTHIHSDHTGNLTELAELTGAKVLVHQDEFENLKKGFTPIPRGQGLYTRIISELGKLIRPVHASPPPYTADLVNENEYSLEDFGIKGRVIFTPGHTAGSQSVLIGKTLIAGDTFINLPNGTIFPHFCDFPEILIKTWEKLYELDIEEIIPGHGKKLRLDDTRAEYEKWKKKLGLN